VAIAARLKEENIWLSIVKHFVDVCEDGSGIKVFFDRTFDVEGYTRWISVQKEGWNIATSGMAEIVFTAHVCTKGDPEGITLSQVKDILVDGLLDSSNASARKSIPIYDTEPETWTPVGYMVAETITEGAVAIGGEDVKFKPVTVQCLTTGL